MRGEQQMAKFVNNLPEVPKTMTIQEFRKFGKNNLHNFGDTYKVPLLHDIENTEHVLMDRTVYVWKALDSNTYKYDI